MKVYTFLLFGVLFLSSTLLSSAQTPLNGFMQGKNGGSFATSMSREHYSDVYLVPNNATSVPVFNEVNINSFNLFASYGINNKLDLIANLPFINISGNSNKEVLDDLNFSNYRSGTQDISAYLKYELQKKGNLSLQAAFGVTTPLSNYNVNEGFQSILAIGNQATTFNLLGIAHYSLKKNFFITTQAGYSFRTTAVPDALLSQIKAGLNLKRIYADTYISNQTSLGGVDILRNGFTGFFPATKVNYTRLGANIYTPLDGNFGINAGGGTTLTGRNLGKSSFFNAGVVYNFIYRDF